MPFLGAGAGAGAAVGTGAVGSVLAVSVVSVQPCVGSGLTVRGMFADKRDLRGGTRWRGVSSCGCRFSA
ncbi:hypothetical protein [Microbacterium enclense]|uniref:hypothetical protein n=1 Tax=Microbacterium enclense TaxID=993073 RepID=UPI003F7E4918